jgi:hypothetical protein
MRHPKIQGGPTKREKLLMLTSSKELSDFEKMTIKLYIIANSLLRE